VGGEDGVTRKKRIGKEKRKEKETKGNSVYIPSIHIERKWR
jgi:hypothetical protein